MLAKTQNSKLNHNKQGKRSEEIKKKTGLIGMTDRRVLE